MPLTPLYECSANDDQIIFGLIFMTELGVLTAGSAVSAVGDDRQNSLSQYSLLPQMATQMLVTTSPPVTVTATTNTPNATDPNPGLTTDQVIGLAVGVVASVVLVLMLTTVIIVLW